MMPRRAASVLAMTMLLAACATPRAPTNGHRPAVENRTVQPARPSPARSAATPAPTVVEVKADDSTQVAELRRTIDRQGRRIAELESRPASGEAESRQVVELLAFSQRIASLPAEEQAREYDAARLDHAREASVYTRIRLAIALSTPGAAFEDDARAAGLLDPLLSQPARTPLRQLAALVHGMVGERLREQKRAAQLKEQIDGLRAIDKSLIEREPARGK